MAAATIASTYRAPRWLPDAHSQTIWPAVYAPRPAIGYQRERWETPDGDFVDLDWAIDPQPAPPDGDSRPLLVVFHGLEGGSRSHYARQLAAGAIARGWRSVVPNFRGCSGEPNRLPRAYHSGDSDEIDWLLRRLKRERAPAAPLYPVGMSLGANALLKWLGERGTDAALAAAAAALSAPHDLHAGAVALSRGFNRIYCWHFLLTLRRKSLRMLQQYPGLLDRQRVLSARDFFDFDDAVTAPLHGFRSALDYWQRSSCGQFLGGIAVPTLVLNAKNDPFQPASALTPPARASRAVALEYPDAGGHGGFIDGPFPGRRDWMVQRIFAHLADPP
ncbi:MAG TPA: alpha/beta fold hydrolase [Burkholderiaceae bacterium]|nr:alpha/beta fold hydrolase [Burkholderiaceae bacterium]